MRRRRRRWGVEGRGWGRSGWEGRGVKVEGSLAAIKGCRVSRRHFAGRYCA